MTEVGFREAILPEPRAIVTVIKEGAPVQTSELQKVYRQSRDRLFDPHVKFTTELVEQTLTAREAELTDAISNSPLKGATDRDGLPLGSLRELTSLSLQEFRGELQAKTALKRTLEMIMDEQERKVTTEAKDLTREGIVVRKDGAIFTQTFPSQHKRDIAANEAQAKKENFLKGKDRLQKYASEIK